METLTPEKLRELSAYRKGAGSWIMKGIPKSRTPAIYDALRYAMVL